MEVIIGPPLSALIVLMFFLGIYQTGRLIGIGLLRLRRRREIRRMKIAIAEIQELTKPDADPTHAASTESTEND